MARPHLTFDSFFNLVWGAIPEIWRTSDEENGLLTLVYTMAQHMYFYHYQKVVSMDELFDPDVCPKKYLPFLAKMLDWKLQGSDEDSWREQIRNAPLLYKIKGTSRGLAVATRLVGYATHTAELYRNKAGELVPREYIFNSEGLASVKPKVREYDVLYGKKTLSTNTLSDNITPDVDDYTYLDKSGDVVSTRRYRRLGSSVYSGKPITRTYNRTSFMNVLLNKLLPLDATTDAGINEAVDLLLQFKPFHIKLNKVSITASLDDNTLTTSINDIVNISAAVTDTSERISYTPAIPAAESPVVPAVPADLNNRGRLVGAVITIDSNMIQAHTICPNEATKQSSGLSLYRRAFLDNMMICDDSFEYATVNPAISIANSEIPIGLLDKNTHTIGFEQIGLPYSIVNQRVVPETISPVISIPLLQEADNIVDLGSFFLGKSVWNGSVEWKIDGTKIKPSGALVLKTDPYNIIIKLTDTTTNTGFSINQGGTTKNPWDLSRIFTAFNRSFASGDYNRFASSDPESDIVSYLVTKSPYLCTITVNLDPELGVESPVYTLLHGEHYGIDYTTKSVIFDCDSIRKFLVRRGNSNYNFPEYSNLEGTTIHFGYVSRVDFFSYLERITMPVRHMKRTSRVADLTYPKEGARRLLAVNQKEYSIDSDGNIVEDPTKTRKYKADSKVLTRSTLYNEPIAGTTAISKDVRNVRDISTWKVRLNQGVNAGTVWGQYFNAPLASNTHQTADFNSIDTSFEAQASLAARSGWLEYQKALDTYITTGLVDDYRFLSSRGYNSIKNSWYTRGTATIRSCAYKSFTRSSAQGYRNEVVLFNRTDNYNDYVANNRDSGSKSLYESTCGRTVTEQWLEGSVSSAQKSFRPPHGFLPNKSQTVFDAPVSKNPAHIGSPSVVPPTMVTDPNYRYNYPYDQFMPDYHETPDGLVKTSLYSCGYNLRYAADVQSDTTDPFGIEIGGLLRRVDQFEVTSSTLASRRVKLNYSDVVFIWTDTNTGTLIANTFYAPVTTKSVKLNILVFVNGVEVTDWTVVPNPNIIEFGRSVSLVAGDNIHVQYYTQSGTKQTVPATLLPRLRRKTQVVIGRTTANQVIEAILDEPSPVVIWNEARSGEYLNISTKTESNGWETIPEGSTETAVPDTVVSADGATLIPYKEWHYRIVAQNKLAVYVEQFITARAQKIEIAFSYVQ